MPAKRKPRGPARQTEIVDPTKPTCSEPKCAASATVFRVMRWFCDRHVRHLQPQPNCGHINTVTAPDGAILCSWCCGELAKED